MTQRMTRAWLFLAVFTTGAASAAEPPDIAPGVSSSYSARITAVHEGRLTAYCPRGHSGIVKNLKLDPKVQVVLLDGTAGKLTDLKVDQWIKVHWKWGDDQKELAIRIELRKPPGADKRGAERPEVTSVGEKQSAEPAVQPLVRAVDLNLGESAEVRLCDGATARAKLLDLKETRDSLRGAVREARVQVEIDGQRVWLVAANYRLPVTIGKVQIDCPITKGTTVRNRRDHWGLDKDARLRLWPAGSPWFLPGKFVYPMKQRWFASATQMANEPVYVDGAEEMDGGRVNHHHGLDFGGVEGMTEVVSATDGLVILSRKKVLPGYEGTPIESGHDVVHVIDSQGWYYRYGHFHTIDDAIRAGARVKAGQRLGLVGKEGGAGGWSHLHFDIFSRQPSGKWGCQEAYAFAWDAYRRQYDPKLVAVARPHHFLAAGERVTLDGSKSWSAGENIVRYQWTFTNGSTADHTTVQRTYDRPGYYSEVLKVTDSAGRCDYDFTTVVVADRNHRNRTPPGIHLAYEPTFGICAGDEVTFQVRMFWTTEGGETWDFGDGSPKARSKSNRNADEHARDGYATMTHRYQRPGQYMVRVERMDGDWPAIAHVHVVVEGAKEENKN